MVAARTPAELIWCGASAPVLQGLLVGLGAVTVGLIVFPFGIVLIRPRSGELSSFTAAQIFVKWGQRLAWALAGFAALTVAGYVWLYVIAQGKFCGARLSAEDQLIVIIWSCVGGVNFVLVILTGLLRWRARRSTGS